MQTAEFLSILIAIAGNFQPAMTVFDFSRGDETWRNIDDTIMGGRSLSEMHLENGKAVFSGLLSLKSGGGFASVRSSTGDHDLSAYRGVQIRLLGDGKTYGLRIKTDQMFDGVSYQALLTTKAGEWQVVTVPFEEFQPVLRGRPGADRALR